MDKTFSINCLQADVGSPSWEQQNHFDAALDIVRRIEAAGYSALVVGGAVRDFVMGLVIKDIDLATSMPLADLAALFHVHDIGRNKDFGIVVVSCQGYSFEVACFRGETDFDHQGAPRTMTTATTFEEDAARRDFTLNAMAKNVIGHILDPEGGQADIAAGLIRAVGDPAARLAEDPLRAVRAVRFAARFGFRIEEHTQEAIVAFAPRLPFVAVERQKGELLKMAALPGPAFRHAVRMLSELGLLAFLLPEVQALTGLDHDPNHHPEGDAFTHTLAAIGASTSSDPAVNLAVLLHDVGKAATLEMRHGRPTYYGHDQAGASMIAAIGERLRFPVRLTRAITFCVVNHMKGLAMNKMKPSKAIKLVMDENWPTLKEVMRSDCAARGRAKDLQDLEETIRQVEETTAVWQERAPAGSNYVISGQRVLDLTGLPPGPRIGEIIRHVTEWAMDQGISDPAVIETEVLRFATAG